MAAGVRGAVQQWGADAEVHADLRARPPVPQEVLRPQRYLQISGTIELSGC
jgi:hypothetical protein